MRGGVRGAVVASVALALAMLIAPAVASAKPPKPPLHASFKLPETSGFRVSLEAEDGKRTDGSTLRFEGTRYSYVSYSVQPTKLTRRKLEIDYGSLGSISLRFRPDKKQTGKCDNVDGTFIGTFRFAAEGVPEISATRVEGKLGRPPAVCIPGLTDRSQLSQRAALDRKQTPTLISCDKGTGSAYGAFKGFLSDDVTFHAAVTEQRVGRVVIRRSLYAFGDLKSLRVSSDGRRARSMPPEPFLGSARLSGGTLTGDLAVPMPGLADPVPLAPALGGILPGFGHRCDDFFLPPESGADSFRGIS